MYKIDTIHYRDIYGKLLWSEPMIYKNLFESGEELINKSSSYVVKRVAIAENIQHVNIGKFERLVLSDNQIDKIHKIFSSFKEG